MFGNIRRRREKKKKKAAEKAKKEQARQDEFNQIENESYLPSPEETQAVTERVDQLSQSDAEKDKARREQNKKEAMEDINTEVKGLTPEQKLAMQESANKQIGGQIQNYSKMLAAQQGSRGVRGGKAQADINRQGLNAQTQVQRDLNIQDADLAMQKLAAYLSSLEGKEAQQLLKDQKYWDYVTGAADKKKASATNKYYNKYYGTV